MTEAPSRSRWANERKNAVSTKGTYLFIADAFYPKVLPPEAKTNAFIATSLAQRGWRVAIWGGAKAAVPPGVPRLKVVRKVETWNAFELIRMAAWIMLHRPARIGLAYFSSTYSMKAHINWLPFIAKWLGIHCTTLFTNGESTNRDPGQDRLFRWLGFAHLLGSPVGPLGASSHMVFYSMADKAKLLYCEDSSMYSYSIVSPPSFLRLPPGAGLRSGDPSKIASTGHFQLGYFGLIYPGKGLACLIKGLSLVLESGISVRLVVIGGSGAVTADEASNKRCEDEEAELHQLALDLKVDYAITWCGYRDESEAAILITDCQAVCLPFDDGVTGLRSSFVECANLGVPVITTLTAATDDFLRAKGSGIMFVEPQNPEQIAAAIARLDADADLRRTCGEQVRHFAATHFKNGSLVDAFAE